MEYIICAVGFYIYMYIQHRDECERNEFDNTHDFHKDWYRKSDK